MRMYKLLKDILNSINNIITYFKMKDVSLWTGSLSAGQSATIPNISSYNIVTVITPYNEILCDIRNGRLNGWTSDYSSGSNVHYATFILGKISGDTLTMMYSEYLAHIPNGGHGTGEHYFPIVEIIGVEPKLAPIFSGGGTK